MASWPDVGHRAARPAGSGPAHHLDDSSRRRFPADSRLYRLQAMARPVISAASSISPLLRAECAPMPEYRLPFDCQRCQALMFGGKDAEIHTPLERLDC